MSPHERGETEVIRTCIIVGRLS